MPVEFDPQLTPLQSQPGILLIHLTNRCNLNCRHCYLEAGPTCHTELPLELALGALSETERLGLSTVYLSGGEPFLYRELPQVLAFAARQPNLALRISTNGTLIDAEQVALAKENNASVQISIDGPEPYHDEFRRSEGAFRRSSRAIQLLVQAGVPVTIVVTICQDNLSYLRGLAEWAAGMGVQRFSVQPLLKYGRGAEIEHKRLTADQLCKLFLELSDLGVAYRGRGLEFALSYHTKQLFLAHPCAAYVCNGAGCHRKVRKEIKRLVVRENGTVLPEIATLNPRFALGNLREGPLSELVDRYFHDGYAEFDRLCRRVYRDIMANWPSPLVPWDEIVADQSWARNELVKPGT